MPQPTVKTIKLHFMFLLPKAASTPFAPPSSFNPILVPKSYMSSNAIVWSKRRASSHRQQQKQQQQDEEEIVFKGRRGESMDQYQPSNRRESHPQPVRGRSPDGGVALQPWEETPERYGNSYRGERMSGGYGDSGRGGHGYENAGYGSIGYGALAQRDGDISNYVRNPRGSFYNHGNTSSSSGAALRNQVENTRELGNARNGQWGSQYTPLPGYATYVPSIPHPHPPPPPVNSYRGESSYRSTRGPYDSLYDRTQEHDRPRIDNWSRPPSRDQNYPAPPRRLERELPYRYTPSTPTVRGGDRIFHAPLPTSAPIFTASKKNKKSKKNKRGKSPKDAPRTVPRDRTPSPRAPTIPHSKLLLPPPKPTPAYIATSLTPPHRLPVASRKLIILDLNGTLLARKCGKARSGSITPTPRPGLHVFLRYIFARYSVMVWSSAQPENVRLMVNALFTRAQKEELLARWGRDTLSLTKAQFNAKVQVYKRLERVWEGEYQVPGKWDQTNTVLLDDSPAKAQGQPWNHVEVKEFLGTKEEMAQDRAMVELVGYLEELRWQENVTAFIREVPFKIGGEWMEGSKKLLEELGWVDGVDVGVNKQVVNGEEINVGDGDGSDSDMKGLEDGDSR